MYILKTRQCLDNCAIQRPMDDQIQLRVRAEAEAVIGRLALCESSEMERIVLGLTRHSAAND